MSQTFAGGKALATDHRLHFDLFFFTLWSIFQSVRHFQHCETIFTLFTVTHFSCYDPSFTVWSIFFTLWPNFLTVTKFSYSGLFLQVWLTFLQSNPLFTLWHIFHTKTHFSHCYPIFTQTFSTLWPIFCTLANSWKCDPFLTLWPIF